MVMRIRRNQGKFLKLKTKVSIIETKIIEKT
jgi:hypothetical protein